MAATLIEQPVLRWEWRTFKSSLNEVEHAIGSIAFAPPKQSSETYILNRDGPQNVKIRDGVLDIKRIRQVNNDGLELWEPVFKAKFPVSRNDIAAVFSEWQLPTPPLSQENYTAEEFLDRLTTDHSSLRTASVVKFRHGFSFQSCTAEFVKLSVDGRSLQSFSLEHESPATVLAALKSLGLDSHANTNYPLGLKRILGLDSLAA